MNLCRQYCCSTDLITSVLIVILCGFLTFISILYAFGQITELEPSNYFCEQKTLTEIYTHSIENDLNHGTNEGCWKYKQFTVKFKMLSFYLFS